MQGLPGRKRRRGSQPVGHLQAGPSGAYHTIWSCGDGHLGLCEACFVLIAGVTGVMFVVSLAVCLHLLCRAVWVVLASQMVFLQSVLGVETSILQWYSDIGVFFIYLSIGSFACSFAWLVMIKGIWSSPAQEQGNEVHHLWVVGMVVTIFLEHSLDIMRLCHLQVWRVEFAPGGACKQHITWRSQIVDTWDSNLVSCGVRRLRLDIPVLIQRPFLSSMAVMLFESFAWSVATKGDSGFARAFGHGCPIYCSERMFFSFVDWTCDENLASKRSRAKPCEQKGPRNWKQMCTCHLHKLAGSRSDIRCWIEDTIPNFLQDLLFQTRTTLFNSWN